MHDRVLLRRIFLEILSSDSEPIEDRGRLDFATDIREHYWWRDHDLFQELPPSSLFICLRARVKAQVPGGIQACCMSKDGYMNGP
jgi:hypothetical protein